MAGRRGHQGIGASSDTAGRATPRGFASSSLSFLRRRSELAELVDRGADREKVNASNGSAIIELSALVGATPVVTCGLNRSPEPFGTNVET